MEVLNPIYDTSFKFLMDDDKSAKILLSALLRQKVLSLTPRQQETATPVAGKVRDITIYRLDYSAHVLTADGREEDVCVEIQKVWLQTELSRFRKYLASQYADEHNVQSDGRTPRHIVAIYLLGHTIAEANEPVVFCHGGALTDYYGHPIATAEGGTFVRSLTHDVVIVQIPLLPERPRNATERVLSIFNQRRALSRNRHLIEIPDSDNEGTEVDVLCRRLSQAACTSEMRRQMQLEDEFLIEVQSREEEIEKQKAILEKQKSILEDQKAILEEQKAIIKERNSAIDEQQNTIEKQRNTLEEQRNTLEEQREALEEKSRQIDAAIKALAKAGLTADAIAVSLGVDSDYVAGVMQREG